MTAPAPELAFHSGPSECPQVVRGEWPQCQGHAVVSEAEIDALMDELKAQVEVITDHDIQFACAELSGLFRAERTLWNMIGRSDRDDETNAKREPFLKIAITLVETERKMRQHELAKMVQEWAKQQGTAE